MVTLVMTLEHCAITLCCLRVEQGGVLRGNWGGFQWGSGLLWWLLGGRRRPLHCRGKRFTIGEGSCGCWHCGT